MRVLFLMDQMYLHGGTERILSQKLNYLSENLNVETYLFTSEQKGKEAVYDISKKVIWKDLEINYERNLSYFHPTNLKKTILHFIKLKKEITILKPDIIMSVSFSPEQYFLPFIHKKIPKLKEFHSSKYVYNVSKQRKFLDKTLKKYDALILLNETEKQYYDNKNIVVIPNFTEFNTNIYNNINREKTIIAAGRIAPVKQFDKLIFAWSYLKEIFPDWKIKIFGSGDDLLLKELNDLIIQLNLSSSVFILQSTPYLEKEMNKASIFAMTSETECFPMVLLEAKACGLPIISFDCPTGPRHIVKNMIDGILVEANNIELFAESLHKLILHKETRDYYAKNGRENVLQYSKEVVMKKWYDFFLKQLNKS